MSRRAAAKAHLVQTGAACKACAALAAPPPVLHIPPNVRKRARRRRRPRRPKRPKTRPPRPPRPSRAP
eukprot:g30953.t1